MAIVKSLTYLADSIITISRCCIARVREWEDVHLYKNKLYIPDIEKFLHKVLSLVQFFFNYFKTGKTILEECSLSW